MPSSENTNQHVEELWEANDRDCKRTETAWSGLVAMDQLGMMSSNAIAELKDELLLRRKQLRMSKSGEVANAF
jgi:hypothetical protein